MMMMMMTVMVMMMMIIVIGILEKLSTKGKRTHARAEYTPERNDYQSCSVTTPGLLREILKSPFP